MRANRDSMSVRKAAGMPQLAPQPMAPETARLGTIRHIERRARSLKESEPIEVMRSDAGCRGPRILGQPQVPVKDYRRPPTTDPRIGGGLCPPETTPGKQIRARLSSR